MTSAAGPRLRIGCVQYLNARPLVDGWPGEVVFDHPAALCEKLAAGELEVALVSSFEFLRAPIYTIVDGASIASDGPVFSVFVAHRGDLETLTSIEIDPASRTSVNLLRCLLNELGLRPAFTANGSDVSAISQSTGRLLIGDQAIRFRHKNGAAYRYFDLGESWRQMTGLPFIYALWLVRPEVDRAESIAEQLRRCRATNLSRLDEMSMRGTRFAPEFCRFYWRECLKFDFGEREKSGLLKFRSLCEQHGILERNSDPLRLA